MLAPAIAIKLIVTRALIVVRRRPLLVPLGATLFQRFFKSYIQRSADIL
jgi:hypothetical protein